MNIFDALLQLQRELETLSFEQSPILKITLKRGAYKALENKLILQTRYREQVGIEKLQIMGIDIEKESV